jgi:tRNA pseudouridine38-40 synthase
VRYKLILEYNGGQFAGWQVQPELRTVQGELQKCLGWLLDREVKVTGAGRTDAGVHALGQVAHFDNDPIESPVDFLARLNSALSHDVCALSVVEVAEDFHARYSALRKTYRYRIARKPSAFVTGLAWRVRGDIDWAAVREATELLLGRHDFSGFCMANSQKEDNTCHIVAARWTENERISELEITADRFLHRMVRLIAGTLIDIGSRRWTPDYMREILASGDVRMAGPAAPPEGLYLVSVEYA